MTEHSARHRILVIDDDASVRMLAGATLANAGFEVVEAVDGEPGIEKFETTQPDLVLLDVLMPGCDGFTVCSRLRASPSGHLVPILMMTGLDDALSIDRAYQAGATDFISKPLNWATLAYRVRYALRFSATFERLAKQEELLANAQRIAALGTWEWRIGSDQMVVSPETFTLLGLPIAEGTLPLDEGYSLIHPEDLDTVRRHFAAALHEGATYRFEYRIRHGDGHYLPVHAQTEPMAGKSGEPIGLRGIIQDVTQRKNAEDQIRRLALFDPLTGLPNRTYMKEEVERLLARAAERGGKLAALFLDLDRFKRINDSLGHSLGDRLLCEVAARLVGTLRSNDIVPRGGVSPMASEVARLGGDEFTIILDPVSRPEDVARVAQRLLDALAAPFALDGYETYITASIGIALGPHDGGSAEELLRNADTAMYAAKEKGKNTFQFFDPAMNQSAQDRLVYEDDLRRAIDRRELLLHYQPRVDVANGRVDGAEALVRWSHPDRGMVSPGDFIPLAEETGLIVRITEWVLNEACDAARFLNDHGSRAFGISVNVSTACLTHPGFVDTVERALRRSGLAPRQLELEVTESVFLKDVDVAVRTLEQLKELEVELSLDDFGTGYSSLAYLRRLPVDIVKIDRSFVSGIGDDAGDTAIVGAIIAMAGQLGLGVVAEGVETAEQEAYLLRQGCRQMQGFRFARPMPFERLCETLSDPAIPKTVAGAALAAAAEPAVPAAPTRAKMPLS